MGQQRRFRLSNGQPVVVPDEWDEDRVAAVLTEMEGELAASPTKTLDMPAGTGGLPMGRPDLFPGIPTRTPPPVEPTGTPSPPVSPHVDVRTRQFRGFDDRPGVTAQNLPLLAGMAAMPFTGGMSLPAAMAVTGGAAGLGSVVGELSEGRTPTVAGTAWEATKGAAPTPLRSAGPVLKGAARRVWDWAVPTRGGLTPDRLKTAEAFLSKGEAPLTAHNFRKVYPTEPLPTQFGGPPPGPATGGPRVRAMTDYTPEQSGAFWRGRKAAMAAEAKIPEMATLAWLRHLATNPKAKSYLAQGLYNTGARLGGAADPATRALMLDQVPATPSAPRTDELDPLLLEALRRRMFPLTSR